MKNSGIIVGFLILIFLEGCNPSEKNLSGNKEITLSSPDTTLVFSFSVNSGMPAYQVSYKGQKLIEKSSLSLDFLESGEFEKQLTLNKPEFRMVDETYDLIVGKNRTVRNYCHEMLFPLIERNAPFRQINLIVRAYNEGIAFRYEFPAQENWKSFVMTDEKSGFNIAGNPILLTLYRENYTTSHEGRYTKVAYNQMTEDTLLDMPTLFDFNGVYMAITEAALLDYAGMYLVKHEGNLYSQLSPLPGQDKEKVKAILPHKSPWRVMLISDRIGDLFESNILTSLNEPCKIADVSWIKPGKTTFPWWNGTVVSDPTIKPGNNFETNKYYIDFCSRNGLEYHSVVEHGGHEWYENNGSNYQPGTSFDVTQPVEGLDMQQVCDYAKSKGVGIRVWVHWKALYPKLEESFMQFEKWGIQGMMVDFMDRDDQEMVNIQTEILERAAAHHLHIQFHGAYKPTGMHRTYPNEFTREGAMNYEYSKWGNEITPDHNLDIIFTRLLAGATDYHMGGFNALPGEKFIAQEIKPYVTGTRCHMLAMYVVLESYLGMACDYPAAYEGQPGFEFVREVPTVWDETKVLGAEVKEYITFARRKKSDWFVGSVTNHEARDITVSFDFLPEGNYLAEIYSDSSDSERNPNHLEIRKQEVTRKDRITIHLASGGGQVMHIRKI